MEEFKTRIKRRIVLFSGMVLTAVILSIFDALIISGSEGSSMTDGIVEGFQFGIILGLGILSLVQTIKLRKIITDERKLKLLYNKENDERLKTIRGKAGMPILMITSVIMLVAAIIAGYFNITVFFTLVITGMAQLSIGAAVKLYFMSKM